MRLAVPLRARGRIVAGYTIALLLVAGTLLLSSACADRTATVAGPAAIAIGVGAIPDASGYENVTRGASLAVERLNETGSLRFRIRLPEKGTQSAVRVAEQLQGDPAVLGVVGHPESGRTIEALPVYSDAEHGGENAVAAISPTASSPRLSGISRWFFRVAPSDKEAARIVARWTLDSLGSRRAAVVYRNDSYGRDWATTFAAAFTDDDHSARVVSREPYLTGITDWDAYARLLGRLRPDVLLFPGDARDAVEMLRALRSAGVSVAFIGGDGTEAMSAAPEAAGARFVAFFRPERATSPEGESFMNRYRARFKTDPDMFAALSYDATLAIGKVIQSGARTRSAVRDALEQLGRSSPAIDGVGGRIAFGADHDIAGRTIAVTAIGERQ